MTTIEEANLTCCGRQAGREHFRSAPRGNQARASRQRRGFAWCSPRTFCARVRGGSVVVRSAREETDTEHRYPVTRGRPPSKAQTASACIPRKRARSRPVGAGMFSEEVIERRPSPVAAAHCT